MSQLRSAPRAAVVPPTSFYKGFFPLVIFVFLTALAQAQVQTPEDKYFTLMSLIDRADVLSEKGQTNSAKAKYMDAQTALADFRKNYPNWNTKLVTYRLNYLAERINTLSKTNAPVVESTEKPATTPGEKSAPKTTSKPATPTGVTVKLLQPGAEPRQALRLHPKAGDKRSSTMTMKMTMGMGPAGEMKMPEMKIPIDITVKSVSPEGDITYDMMMGQAQVADSADPTAAMMKESLGKLGGETGTSTITSRGLTKSTKMNIPKDANPQTRQTMEQMQESLGNVVFMLPDEAVGAGAKWEIKQTIKQQNMTISQATAYELISLEGDVVKVKSNVSQSAANQKIESPAMPGMKVDLNKLTGTGTGNMTFDLGQIMPTQGATDMQTEISMGINMGDQKQNMDMKVSLNMTVEAKK